MNHKLAISISLFFLMISFVYAIEVHFVDLDSNLIYMNNPAVIYHKTDGSTATIYGEELDRFIEHHGAGTRYADYEMRFGPGETLRYHREGLNGENLFDQTIENFLKKPHDLSWQAPMWDYFVKRCATKEGASRVFIVTSRGQPPKQIYDGLMRLVRAGHLNYPIPLENIWPVHYPEIQEKFTERFGIPPSAVTNDSSQRKALVIKSILKEFPDNEKVISLFSDDSAKNISEVTKGLLEESNNPHRTLYFHQTITNGVDQDFAPTYQLLGEKKIAIAYHQFEPDWKRKDHSCATLLFNFIKLAKI